MEIQIIMTLTTILMFAATIFIIMGMEKRVNKIEEKLKTKEKRHGKRKNPEGNPRKDGTHRDIGKNDGQPHPDMGDKKRKKRKRNRDRTNADSLVKQKKQDEMA